MTYMPTLGTLISYRPFVAEHETNDKQEDAVEIEPTSQPEIYRPPTHENFQDSGGAQQNNLL